MSYLLMLKGPNPGERHELDRPQTILGREPSCHVLLRSPEDGGPKPLVVSRRHAVITQSRDGKYYIEDGDGQGKASRNRTLVNGERVPFPGRIRLRNDDVITICDYVLLFHDSGDTDPSSIDGAIKHDSSSVFLDQPAERLRLLLELTNGLSKTLNLDVLVPHVVETLLQLFKHADNAFLILVDEASGALVSRSRMTRRPGEEAPLVFSTRIVEHCLHTMEAVLCNDPGARFPESDSVIGLALRTAICAPLWSQDSKAFGVLYLDSRNDRKKFSQDDLNLLMGVASQASIALTNARFYRDSLTQERLNRDLAIAREVVRSFLPARVPDIPGYEFFACNQSALEVGGDYYDFIEVGGDRLAVLVGDVVGKGVPAALVMARFSANARACLRTETDLAAAVRQLNTLTQHLSLTSRFVTLAALMLDPRSHTITAVNAGHPSPLWLHGATGAVTDLMSRADGGPMLGVEDGYPYEVRQVVLEPGDSLVIFSDGVTDGFNVAGKQFGLRGLRGVLHAPARRHGSWANAS